MHLLEIKIALHVSGHNLVSASPEPFRCLFSPFVVAGFVVLGALSFLHLHHCD